MFGSSWPRPKEIYLEKTIGKFTWKRLVVIGFLTYAKSKLVLNTNFHCLLFCGKVPKQGSTLLCGWYTIFFFAHVAFRLGSLDGKFDEIFVDNDMSTWTMGILESLKLFINGVRPN